MSLPPRRGVPRGVRRRRPATVFAIAFLALLLPATAALAKAPLTKFAAGPIPANLHCDPNITQAQLLTTAAARTDFCVAFYVASGDPARGDDLKGTVADTPQGFLATADTSPQCTLAQLNVASGNPTTCPAGAQIGEGEALLRVDFNGITIPQTVHAKIWNVTHSPDEVAGIAIDLAPELGGIALPHVKLTARTTLRSNPDVGLRTLIDNQPRYASLGSLLGTHPIAIDGFFLRFWGSKTDHPSMPQSFGLMGSDCSKDQVSKIESTSYAGDKSNSEYRYRLTDCDHVPFGLKTTVTTEERRPDVPTAVTVDLQVDQHDDPRVNGNMSSTTLTLPPGIDLGAQIASGDSGLPLCTAAQFGWDNSIRSSCPEGSKVADVDFISPLQANVFKGAAYVGEQPAPGELPQLFIEGGFGTLPDSPRVKLRSAMKIDDQGRITTRLDDLPQVLFREFKLTFRGGDHAAMSTPRSCGTFTGGIDAVPASTGVPVHQDLPITIDQDCIDPNVFQPTVATTSANPVAGGRGTLTVATNRPDRQARISKIAADLPAGVISDLNLATECTVAQAAATACPDKSRIGTVVGSSGVGPAPFSVPGTVFLMTRDEGAVAGVVISVPVRFGGVDLGTMNVPARIELRPGDLGLRFTADVPTRYKGLNLNLRSFVVSLDRPDFAINPTNCSPLSTVSTLTSDLGGTASVPGTFQVSGCEGLSFNPSLGFKLTGKTGQADKPAVEVTVGLATGGSNIKSTTVTMPEGIAADLKQVPRACASAAWEAGTCGADAVVGSLVAHLAITNETITGTTSLVKIDGQTLPGIGMQLQGRFAARILGRISVAKVTSQLVTTFPTLPDVPITSLALSLEGGARGALVTTKALCTAPNVVLKGSFVGQSGATADRTATTNCNATQSTGTAKVKVSGNARGKVRLTVTAAPGKKINALKFALPSGVTLAKKQIGKKKLIRGTKTVTASGKRTLAVKLAKAGRATVTVTLPKGLFVLNSKTKKVGRFAGTVRVGYFGGAKDGTVFIVKK